MGGTDSGNKEKLMAAIFFALKYRGPGGPGSEGPPLDPPMSADTITYYGTQNCCSADDPSHFVSFKFGNKLMH